MNGKNVLSSLAHIVGHYFLVTLSHGIWLSQRAFAQVQRMCQCLFTLGRQFQDRVFM
jgi:hypothetical protein